MFCSIHIYPSLELMVEKTISFLGGHLRVSSDSTISWMLFGGLLLILIDYLNL